MKRFCVFFVVLLLTGTALAQQPTDPATKEDVQQLLNLMQIRKQADSVMEAMKKQNLATTKMMTEKMTPGIPEADLAKILKHSDELWDQMAATMPWDAMMNASIPAYQHHFTHGDIQEMIRFYSSPVGKKFIDKGPALATESMQAMSPIMQKWMEEQIPVIQKETEAYAKAVVKEKTGAQKGN